MELYRDIYSKNPEFILAEKVCGELRSQGFKAYLAGGCVRDFLLKRVPQDFDVATNALPDQVEKIFKKTISVGKNFGVIVVVDEVVTSGPAVTVEVATFRKDGAYEDGRHPENVEFSDEQEDALRRDLTVNAFFFDLEKNQVIDYVNGVQDIQLKVLRSVGDPEKRFQEDHLRILRTVRFSSQLGFEIESATWAACRRLAALICKVSGERIQDELSKLLLGNFVKKGLAALFDSGLLAELLNQKDMVWKSPEPYFSDETAGPEILETRWFEFFFWISQMLPADGSGGFFEEIAGKWRFSKELKAKTLKALAWTSGKKALTAYSLGELIALSFEPEQDRGLRCYGKFFLPESEKSLWTLFLEKKEIIGAAKPAPWVISQDLVSEVQGADLGRALRFCYYRQLEGSAQNKAELIAAWRKQHGNK